MTTLLQDIHYALRQFRKSLGFTAIAVISLALAIGANTTIFSFANQMLFLRLGVPHPEQLRNLVVHGDKHVAIHSSWGSSAEDPNGGFRTTSFTLPIYQQLREQNTSLQDIFAYKRLTSVNVTAAGAAQSAQAELVSGNLYAQMQVQPQLGRAILPSDDTVPGTGAVAVLSDPFWHRVFGGSPDVLGKTITINNTLFTIIGVNPAGFTGPERASSSSPELFVPLSMVTVLHPGTKTADPLSPDFWWLELMARAKPGVSNTQAEAALDVAINAAVRGTMTLKKDETVPHISLNDGSRGDNFSQGRFAKPLYLLLGFSGLVLLLACTNIANLMLSRATLRQREMSVRMALGAGRLRILRQVLTESILLSVLGGLAGLFLGYLGRNFIPWLFSSPWEAGDLSAVAFDWRVFAFTSAITLATGILFGLAPAWRSTHTSINTALKEGSRSATRSRRAWSGKAIVGFQVALSTLLVMSAAFFIRTIVNLNAIDPGFHAQNLLLVDVNPPEKQYPSPKDVALDHRLEEAFAAIPGVQVATLANIPLVADSMSNAGFLIEGEKKSTLSDDDQISYLDAVGANFFSAMQIPLLAGRSFSAQDTETSTPVSIVNQALAKKFFPNTNPIGKRFRMGTTGDSARWVEIIGICADTRYADLRDAPPPTHFDLYRQQTEIGGITYIIRSSLAPAQLIPALRKATQQIDPDLPLTNIRTQQQQIEADMQQERTFASLTIGFGFLALGLACVGIYGIMAYTVSQRTNEIGIRLALGAARDHIRSLVLRETAWLAAIGVVLGLAATLALAKLIESMLYGLKPTDPLTLGISVLVLLLVALIAGWIPAYRASQVNPIDALRSE
jgi:predicted permease